MTRADFLLALPIIWAVTATGIGLVLYRSSKALFETGEGASLPAKRIRLTGSAAIAAVSFLGMHYVTPRDALEKAAQESRSVPKQELAALVDRSRRLEAQIMEINACAEMTGSVAPCQEVLVNARASARSMREAAESLSTAR